ncbi:sensor histidine kinase [Parvibacter caecicola]|nr:histidine kinase [Parvibacter caecicola]MBB3170506.1 signal transduction histidine kinase [Parvibacter caecicola]MCR2041531.1 histidine kinase [Parvibacter caecicola]
MDRAIDQTVLLVLCTACALHGLPGENPAVLVGACLAAFSAAGLMEFFRAAPHKAATGIVFLAACCAWAPLGAFAPLGAYGAVVNHQRWLAPLWLVPLLLCWPRLNPAAFGALALLAALAAFMAWRSRTRTAEEQRLRTLRDNLQEEHLALAARARNLQERQDLEVHCAVLDERGRIAREIHDNVGHLLTRALLQTRALAVSRQEDAALSAAIAPLETTLDEALATVRASVHNLHQEAFDPRQALEEAVCDLPSLQGTLRYEVCHLPRPVALAAIAIVREGLSNAVNHGHASAASVALEEFPGFFRLRLENNGTARPTDTDGMGIASMRQRAEALGGSFSFAPREPHLAGSRIIATFPKQQEQP